MAGHQFLDVLAGEVQLAARVVIRHLADHVI